MLILIEPSDYALRNSGDTAMLEVAITRLSALFPDASINVLSDVPSSFPRWAPHVQPIASTGRHAYVAQMMRGRAEVKQPMVRRVGRWIRRLAGTPAGPRSNEIQAFDNSVVRAPLRKLTCFPEDNFSAGMRPKNAVTTAATIA